MGRSESFHGRIRRFHGCGGRVSGLARLPEPGGLARGGAKISPPGPIPGRALPARRSRGQPSGLATLESHSPDLDPGPLPAAPRAAAEPSRTAAAATYRRYHLETRETPDVARHPSRFRVRVKKHKLVGMVLHELLVEYRGRPQVALSRPCVYGVFGRPVGGLAPRHALCVGCLRCTTQYPEMVAILPNPARRGLGDSFLTPELVDTILLEARTGAVPVRGAGYRGRFGGEGWDGMWTDMSEIVRPTRDGIHGREFISTAVDLGAKLPYLRLDASGTPLDEPPPLVQLPVPLLFDLPPRRLSTPAFCRVLAAAARAVETLVLLPLRQVLDPGLAAGDLAPHVAPIVAPGEEPLLDRLAAPPAFVELDAWDPVRHAALARRFPSAVVAARLPMDADPLPAVAEGARVLHLVADLHGRAGGGFAMDLLLAAHRRLVEAGVREEVTLVGSGGIAAAEHVPKALICGLDAVALDSALWVALQARFGGECRDREEPPVRLPRRFPEAWAVQRLQNLVAAWRDQLLEILGAMGLREVRRLRGEVGRCMFQRDLEREAFAGIEGYEG